MCETLSEIVEFATIPCPEMLGDDYAEVIESLSRLADAGLRLNIRERSPAGGPQAKPMGWPDFAGLRRREPLPDGRILTGFGPNVSGELEIEGW
jgi:hypothetical protein